MRIGTRFASEAKAYIRIESANWTEAGRREISQSFASPAVSDREPRYAPNRAKIRLKNSSFDSSIQERAMHYYLSLSFFFPLAEKFPIFLIFSTKRSNIRRAQWERARARV